MTEFTRLNPMTGEVASRAQAMQAGDIPAIAARAQAGFEKWSVMGPNARRAVLNKAADALMAKKDEFIAAMMGEIGATAGWAMFNLGLAPGMVREAALHDLARVDFRTIEGAAEQLLERDHAMPRVQEKAGENLVGQGPQAARQVFARAAGLGERLAARQALGQVAGTQLQGPGQCAGAGGAQPRHARQLRQRQVEQRA